MEFVLASVVFLLVAGLYGGFVAVINNLLRKNGMESPFTTTILILSKVVVYYYLWRWFCRKLDNIAQNDK